MKTQLTEVRENLRRCEDDLETQNRATAMMEAEKLDLMEVKTPIITMVLLDSGEVPNILWPVILIHRKHLPSLML